MEKFLNSLENAAYHLKDKGEQAMKKAGPVLQQGLDKAVDGAKAAYQKAKPALEDGLERTKEAYEKAKPAIERAVMKAADACERAAESLRKDGGECSEETAQAPDDAAETRSPQEDPDPAEQLDLDVEAQMEKIRAARQESNVISDYVSKKFGKDDQ